MGADVEAARGRHFDGSGSAGEVVAAVYVLEGGVVAGLHPVFYLDDVAIVLQFLEKVELFIVNAVGAGADDYADHVGVGKGFPVDLPEPLDGAEGVAVGLEVGEIVAGAAVADLVEFNPFVQLLPDALPRDAVARVEGGVVAVGAAAAADGAVAVRAAEAGVDDEFLETLAVFFAEPADV